MTSSTINVNVPPSIIEKIVLRSAAGGGAPNIQKLQQKKLKGVGYLSDMCLVEAELDDSQTVQVVFKMLPKEKESLALVESGGLFETERKFYCHAGTELGFPLGFAHVPTCLYPTSSSNDDDQDGHTSKSLLGLEFCHGSVPDMGKGLDKDQALRCMAALAELHANFLFFPPSSSPDSSTPSPRPNWLIDVGSNTSRSADLFKMCLTDDLLGRFHDILQTATSRPSEELKQIFQRFLSPSVVDERVERVVGKGYTGPRAICHGDLWSGNLLLGDKVTFVDWQFVGFSNPMIDVSTLLCSSASPEVWVHCQEEVIAHYLKHLGMAAGRELGWSLEDCCDCFRSSLSYAFLMMSASIDAWLAPGAKDRENIIERYVALIGCLETYN